VRQRFGQGREVEFVLLQAERWKAITMRRWTLLFHPKGGVSVHSYVQKPAEERGRFFAISLTSNEAASVIGWCT
jgi:hypothetical protein